MNWWTRTAQQGDRQRQVRRLARRRQAAPDLSPITAPFFGCLPGHCLGAALVVRSASASSRGSRQFGYLTAAPRRRRHLGSRTSRMPTRSSAATDHSLGCSSPCSATSRSPALVSRAAKSRAERRHRGFVDRVFAWRPGCRWWCSRVVVGRFVCLNGAWFGPLGDLNDTLARSRPTSADRAVAITSPYISWLGCVAVLRHPGCSPVCRVVPAPPRARRASPVVALAGVVLTLLTSCTTSEGRCRVAPTARQAPGTTSAPAAGWRRLHAVRGRRLAGCGAARPTESSTRPHRRTPPSRPAAVDVRTIVTPRSLLVVLSRQHCSTRRWLPSSGRPCW